MACAVYSLLAFWAAESALAAYTYWKSAKHGSCGPRGVWRFHRDRAGHSRGDEK